MMNGKPSGPGTKAPALTPDEVVAEIQALLIRLGDFSGYVESVKEDRDPPAVAINVFTHRPACSTLPRATTRRGAVPEWRLAKAMRTIELLSRGIEKDVPLAYEQVRGSCVIPLTGELDPVKTAALGHSKEHWVEEPQPDPPAAPGEPPSALARLAPEQIVEFAVSVLQDYGDLAIYLSRRDDGTLVIKEYSSKSASTLPGPTPPHTAVAKDRLEFVRNAVAKLNESFLAGATSFFYEAEKA